MAGLAFGAAELAARGALLGLARLRLGAQRVEQLLRRVRRGAREQVAELASALERLETVGQETGASLLERQR